MVEEKLLANLPEKTARVFLSLAQAGKQKRVLVIGKVKILIFSVKGHAWKKPNCSLL